MELTFSEFLLNHLHSNHKHRRFNGDSLDLTMVVPQLEYEIAKWSGLLCILTVSAFQEIRLASESDGEWCAEHPHSCDVDADERASDHADVAICRNIQPQEILLSGGPILHHRWTCRALLVALVLR